MTTEAGRARVLVTGATGTVGTPLVRRLLDAPEAVRIAARALAAARERFGDGPEYVERVLGRPARSVREFVADHAEPFGGDSDPTPRSAVTGS